MRNHQCVIDSSALRAGDRSDVAGEPTPTEVLATEVIRLARLATSLHLAEQARLLAGTDAAPPHATLEREPVA